jgi:hypothetical protein
LSPAEAVRRLLSAWHTPKHKKYTTSSNE